MCVQARVCVCVCVCKRVCVCVCVCAFVWLIAFLTIYHTLYQLFISSIQTPESLKISYYNTINSHWQLVLRGVSSGCGHWLNLSSSLLRILRAFCMQDRLQYSLSPWYTLEWPYPHTWGGGGGEGWRRKGGDGQIEGEGEGGGVKGREEEKR